MSASSNPILLYDGVCGLCNRLVQFTLRHDRDDVFRFASLQSTLAARLLGRHGASATDLDTFYVVADPEQPSEHLFARSDAARFVLTNLGGGWAGVAEFCKLLPHPLRDAIYNLVARNRYKIFGKLDACAIPDPRHRAKFLDQ
jgi:predicted DCC family thiol-disulfide oxidoreductase YuxK